MAFVAATNTDMANGKRRLIDAALELGGAERGLSTLGIRELARHAGLNPNSFYRHFVDLEDLGRAVADEVVTWILHEAREIRGRALDQPDSGRAIVEFFFDAVRAQPAPFVIGLHELYGGSRPMRDVIRATLETVALESAQQMRDTGQDGGLREEVVRDIARVLTDAMFHDARTVIDHPAARDRVVKRTIRLATTLFAGAAITSTTPRRRS